MSDYSELVERMRAYPANRLCVQVADALEAQAKEIAEFRAALKPFAYYAEQIPDDVSATASASGTVGDLRAARAALKGANDV
jgi:hypothetical protein